MCKETLQFDTDDLMSVQ